MPLTPTEKIWMDGELVDWADATVHVLTHTMHYGSGVFEGIRAYPTQRGVAVFRLRDHIERLFASAKVFLIDVPFTVDEIVDATRDRGPGQRARRRVLHPPLVYLGYGEMGLNPMPCPVNVSIAAWPWGTYLGDDGVANGVSMKISSWRRHDPNAVPTAAKGTGMYVNSSLAKVEAIKAGLRRGHPAGPGRQRQRVHRREHLHRPQGPADHPTHVGLGCPGGHHPAVGRDHRPRPGLRGRLRADHPHRPLHGRRGLPHRDRRRGGAHPGRRRPVGRGRQAGTDHPEAPADLLRRGPGRGRPVQGLVGLCRVTDPPSTTTLPEAGAMRSGHGHTHGNGVTPHPSADPGTAGPRPRARGRAGMRPAGGRPATTSTSPTCPRPSTSSTPRSGTGRSRRGSR